jgi:hypothetical protein
LLDIPSESANQPRCKHCGEIIPAGDRRPQQYCSSACRQADYRKRRQEAANGSEPADQVVSHPTDLIAPTTESAKSGAEFTNNIKGRNFVTNGSSVPLDLFGRGYRWPAKANGNAVRIAAAVDAELGVGADWLSSSGGAKYQIIPSRHRR